MRSVRKTKSKYRAKDRLLTHKGHGDDVTDALSAVVENAAYADVKVTTHFLLCRPSLSLTCRQNVNAVSYEIYDIQRLHVSDII